MSRRWLLSNIARCRREIRRILRTPHHGDVEGFQRGLADWLMEEALLLSQLLKEDRMIERSFFEVQCAICGKDFTYDGPFPTDIECPHCKRRFRLIWSALDENSEDQRNTDPGETPPEDL